MKKILCLYLPQFHSIPENDKWWGEGYTEWTAVRKAKPLFKGHKQPVIPLNHNYYDLSEEDAATWKWQSELAKKYGVYGFAIYHYWFGNSKMLLEKPMEILLKHKEIDIKYCIVWANETWTKTWYNLESTVLIEQTYGDEQDWTDHFNYMSKFFEDERYIKIDGKPVINIYKTKYIHHLDEMLLCWKKLAIKHGFPGIYVVSGNTIMGVETRIDNIDAFYNFEPGFSLKYNSTQFQSVKRKISILKNVLCNKALNNKRLERIENIDSVYKAINNGGVYKRKTYLGTFPKWDNTPRRGYKGSYYKGATVKKFYNSLKHIYDMSEDESFIYINAWNEWGEGCMLEPTTTDSYSYLEAIKRVVSK
ncbi:glycoside hydrolase family 99-like domain-containing protein [Ruminococcus sp. FC2018]|uniref:glycosyltransferase WbsX family protein n=1 Tax=Ruminococcus sp. FC2018 TaxID=1410617 RepID=UPI00048EA9D1|nr:glycoside hydrolase family 99-like domain-containing protein [Ruminococcus sp. FC2018]